MTAHVLDKPPSLGPLFAKAVVAGALRRGRSALQDRHISLADQIVDPVQLAKYQRVCGFRVGDVLPVTYLHILSFPLSVVRMTEPDFPFPLLGLVHIQNLITQVRPVTVAETVSLDVWSDNLRSHPAGQQVDLVSEASVDGEIVWSGTSTYLRRGSASKDGRREQPPVADRPAGTISQWRVPGDIGRKYAAVSGDRNPIHLHTLTAKAFGFPRAIAHGMWLNARTVAAFEGRLPGAFTVDVSFKTPVLLPSTVELAATRLDEHWRFDLRDARSGKPHVVGEIWATA